MPDSSQLDPSPQHSDFLSFHSDSLGCGALSSRPKVKRVEFASEPSSSFDDTSPEGRGFGDACPEGREFELGHLAVVQEMPPQQQDLLSGGEAEFLAETEWLVPSLDQAPQHQGPYLPAQVVS